MEFDTIVVPTPTGEFRRVFVGEGCWYPLKMAAENTSKVKWAAAYETAPKSAITHIARVSRVKRHADGTYKVMFDDVKRIRPSRTRRAFRCPRQHASMTTGRRAAVSVGRLDRSGFELTLRGPRRPSKPPPVAVPATTT